MLGKSSNSQVRPYALGLTPQSSIYGSTIPVLYGTTRGAYSLIWAQNLRESQNSPSKFKVVLSGNSKQYVQNVDLLFGHNPIVALLQYWKDKNDRYLLEFDTFSQSITPGVEATITIPDARFYMLMGVTLTVPYSFSANDYGGQGSVTQSGDYEIPLWNAAYVGPDRVNMNAWRNYPFTYWWLFGTAPTIDLDTNKIGALPAGTINLYYARIPDPQFFPPALGDTPLAKLNLTFERQLGTGPEYSGYEDQIIVYSAYAGAGSPAFNVSVGAMPNLRIELMGAFPLYRRGDADFADMVEDIFKGVAQSTVGEGSNTPAYAAIRHGLDCFEFPGMIQKVMRSGDGTITALRYPLQTTVPSNPGSILIAVARNDAASPLAISDTQGNTWVKSLLDNPDGKQFWMVYPATQAFNTATISPGAANSDLHLMEFFGLDGIPAQERFDGTDGPILGSITTTQPRGVAAYLLAVLIANSDATNIQPAAPPTHWKNLMVGQGRIWSMYRIVNAPGTYEFKVNPEFAGGWTLVLIAFAPDNPPVTWSKPLGNILDEESLELCRTQCRANGLIGSLNMDSQKPASDWLTDLAIAMNSAPVWSGFSLKFRPWSEVSYAGNGAQYSAPTSSGPIADLTDRDFQGNSGEPMIKVTRKGQVDRLNLIQIQHPNRSSDYNDAIIASPDQGPIAQFGTRKASPRNLRCVQDVEVSRMLANILTRRQNSIVNEYSFKLKANWKLLEPMDLVTITDEQVGIDHLPVRIIDIQEDEKYSLDVKAEPFIYGIHAPHAVPIGEQTAPDPYNPALDQMPGLVNAPIIFEPTAELAGFPTQSEIWLAISNSDDIYGGSQIFISTDGGSSYNLLGSVAGNATTGVLTGTWPTAVDPDAANNLLVDLSESFGALNSYTADQRDASIFPCYVENVPATPPPLYELMSYRTATLGGPYNYTLVAADTLRRGILSTVPADHTSGARFAFLDPSATGIFKFSLPAGLIGATLYFKVRAFNQFGGGFQDLADCTAYAFVPQGA